MSECKFLAGENIAPRCAKDAKALIGKHVRYLKELDIDKSGRGYFSPKTGRVSDSHGRQIEIDGDYIMISTIREMVLIPLPAPPEA